jgi:hypothetical protein
LPDSDKLAAHQAAKPYGRARFQFIPQIVVRFEAESSEFSLQGCPSFGAQAKA